MSSPHQAVEDLRNGFQMLNLRWGEARAVWNDVVRQYFERTYWEPLEHEVRATHEEAARLAEVLVKAVRNAP